MMATIAGVLAPGIACAAPSEGNSFAFAIDGGSLQHALVAYAALTGQQLIYSADMVAHRSAPTLRGHFTADEALERLLRGTALHARRLGPRLLILDAVRPATQLADRGSPVMTAPVQESPDIPQPIAPAPERMSNPSKTPDQPVDSEIVVIGSHIRGNGHSASPVQSFTRADMERNGYATIAQALAALPANFGGMATEQSALAFTDGAGGNGSLATGVNLRGLGADATLVLVNGRRIAGSGSMGDFGDISSIPTGAVDRVDILLDGASAIYGSDAVGGVVNIQLKKRFDGAETQARFGSVTDGGARSVQLDQTVGKTWATGSVMLSYEYDLRTPLSSNDRAFARSADSRPFGGTDHRFYLSLPGNVLGFDPTTGAFGPAFAIPGGQNGTALTPADFEAGVTNLQNFRRDVDLTPRQERHSAYLTLSQDVGDRVQLWAEGRYSHRAFAADSIGAATIATVTPANPYFVSPTGAPADLIAYYFGTELGPTHVHGTAVALAGSAGIDVDLGHGWKFSGYGSFAQERDRDISDNTINSQFLNEAIGAIPDDPSTGFSTAVDGFFNPYGDGSSNSRALLDFIGSGYTSTIDRSRVTTGDIQADGPLFRLGGGAVRLAVGGDIRREAFLERDVSFVSTSTPVVSAPLAFGRTVKAGFAELQAPLVGPANAAPGVQRLDLSAAVRVEHYDDFGTTTNPKFGLNWVPVGGVTLKATYGTSFRAPNLRELQQRESVSTNILERPDGLTTAVIELGGGNPNLKPETARTWTLGVDFRPPGLKSLTVSANLFRTIFDHQIGQPVYNDQDNALIDPDLAPFVRLVSPTTNAADLAYVSGLLANPMLGGSGSFPASTIGAVVDMRYVNTGKLDVRGIDMTIRYARDFGANHIDLTANATRLLRYSQQFTPASASVDQLNLAEKPVALRGRLSTGWSRSIWNALLGADYVGRYHDLAGNRIHAWTTIDLQLGIQPVHGVWKGLSISLVAQNLFDRAPPFYDSTVGAGYDAANADATGRVISLQLTKRW